MHSSYEVFSAEINNHQIQISLPELLRHYRQWQKSTQGAYKTMTSDETAASTFAYISGNMPTHEMIAISDCINGVAEDANPRFFRWLNKKGIDVFDTLLGYYTTNRGEKQLEDYYTYCSLRKLFILRIKSRLGKDANITENMFQLFKQQCRINGYPLEKLEGIYPDASGELFYPPSYHTDIFEFIEDWIAINLFCYQHKLKNGVRLADAAREFELTPQEMLDYIRRDRQTYCRKGAFFWIFPSAIRWWRNQISDAADLTPLITEISKEYKNLKVAVAIDIIKCRSQTDNYNKIFCGNAFPGGSQTKWFYKKSEISDVITYIHECVDNVPLFPLSTLSAATGLTNSELKKRADDGVYHIERIDGKLLISKHEIKRINSLITSFIGLDDVVFPLITETCSIFNYDNFDCRTHLHDFIIGNKWWEAVPVHSDEIAYRNTYKNDYYVLASDAEQIRTHLYLWIKGYSKSNRDKVILLLDYYKDDYPKTSGKLWSYFSKRNASGLTVDDIAVKNAIDSLLPMLPRELDEMNEDEIDNQIIAPLVKDAAKNCCIAISVFLSDCGYTSRSYGFDSTGYELDKSAYELSIFALMAYTVINTEAWTQNDLLNKAVFNKRFADCWLFIALHFFAAWRTTDFIKLSAPLLPYPAQETLERIRAGSYSAEAERVAQYFLKAIEYGGMRPSKTENHSNVPELHMFVPTSCEEPLGIILSIAAAHYELSGGGADFIQRINDIGTIQKFFGVKFADACSDKRFSTRRANKALIQGVADISDDNDRGSPKSYLLASVMRSHKGGYGKLPDTTAIYLKDANFSGYTPEFIIYQMFERGVCSFVIDILLKESFGETYRQLPVSSQTSLIKSVGLNAPELETLVRAVQTAQDSAQAIASEIVENCAFSKVNAKIIFHSIINGQATGKRVDSICAMRATGYPCKSPDRIDCAGCLYEIKTKASLSYFASEFQRITFELKEPQVVANPMEFNRRKYVLKNVVFPAIAEIYACSKAFTSPKERQEYGLIIKEVLNDGTCGKGKKRELQL